MATIRSSTPAHSIHETTGISSPCRKSVPPFPGAPGKPLEGRNVPKPCSLPRRAMIRRATLQRLCPQGKQRRPRTPAAPLALPGQGSVAQRTPSQAAGSRSWVCRCLLPPSPHPNRNAARPSPARGERARRSHGGDVPQGPEDAARYAGGGEDSVDAHPLYTARGQGRSLTAFTLFSRCQHCAASVSARSS